MQLSFVFIVCDVSHLLILVLVARLFAWHSPWCGNASRALFCACFFNNGSFSVVARSTPLSALAGFAGNTRTSGRPLWSGRRGPVLGSVDQETQNHCCAARRSATRAACHVIGGGCGKRERLLSRHEPLAVLICVPLLLAACDGTVADGGKNRRRPPRRQTRRPRRPSLPSRSHTPSRREVPC